MDPIFCGLLTVFIGLAVVIILLQFFIYKRLERQECRKEKKEVNLEELYNNEQVIPEEEIDEMFTEYLNNKETNRSDTPPLDALDT